MDADSFRPESHIQQQSRRYKLRIQQTSPHNLRKFPGDSQQLPLYPATVLPSVMAASSCNNLSSDHSGDGMVNRPVRGHEDCAQMITNVPNYGIFPESSLDVATSSGAGDPWRGHGAQQGSDWMVNYAGGSGVIEVLFNNSVSTSIPHQQLKPHQFDGYNDFDHEVSPAVVSGSSQPIYHSYLHSGNENYLVSRPAEAGLRWDDGLRHLSRKSDQELRTLSTDAGTHGLSLSLSSNASKMDAMQFREQLFDSEFLRSTEGNETEGSDQESKLIKLSSNSGAIQRPSIIRRTSRKSLQELVSPSTSVHRSTGPLGPFTGYATILKSSRFLKPAQELLDEICIGTSLISARVSEAPSDAMSGSLGNSNMSSSTIRSSNDCSGDRSSSRELFWPEYQQKKAKLLCLQEEVCRRYKQYHQQMQIVASSFELVAGLDAATPFLSSALKTISRSCRCLKHAISDQLKQVMQTLGEEFLSPNAHATGSQVDAGVPGGANVAFLEPQQHAWRPQRGLPERAVAVLRAWLFEHFLHPYPTDTDKQMLASQTGLSRNQVSNWFINARVRVWKPMVEEIHMLETKGVPESNQSSRENDATSCQGSRQTSRELSSNKATTMADCSGIGFSVGNDVHFRMEQWDQEKRQTSTFDPPTNMDGSSMSFLPYHRGGLDIGGLGTVSLTLGLRHDVDKVQHRQQAQQQQHHDDQLMRLQFGGQMIHDFTV